MCSFGCHITSNGRKKKIYSAKALILRPVSTRRRRFSSRCVWSFRRNGPSASKCLIQSYEIGGDGRLTLSQQILGRIQVPLGLQHRKEVREPGFVLHIRQLQSRFVRPHSAVKPLTPILLFPLFDNP